MPAPVDYKQILVLRKDINMRKGKMAAQAAHAAMAALIGGPATTVPRGVAQPFMSGQCLTIPLDPDTLAWLQGAFKKICVSVNSEAELLALPAEAVQAGLRCALIQDNGLTEFGGVPTYTAVAIGPHASERLAPLTGNLPLL